MKAKIFLILFFFSVLLVLFGLYQRFSKQEIERGVRAVSSTWLSVEQNNMVYIDAGYTSDREPHFEEHSVLIEWDGYKSSTLEPMAENGKSVYRMPGIPLNDSNCADLEINWQPKMGAVSTKAYCSMFGVDDMIGYRANRFSDWEYSPRSEFAVYPLSAFIPGKPNEVLLVDIKDGVPYQGEIKVEQLNAPPGTMPQIGQANASGVTSLNITLDDRADFRFTAGNDVLVVSFAPNRKSFHVEVDDYLMLYNKNGKTEIPHVRITPGGAPTDFMIDYFVGYAWIKRQIVPADKLSEPIALDPGYKITKDDPVIVYAMISTNAEPATSGAQVFPFVAKISQPDKAYDVGGQWRAHNAADLDFSAIYQEYVKLKTLNSIDLIMNFRSWYTYENRQSGIEIQKIYGNPELHDEYEIFSVASVLKDLLVKDLVKEPKTGDEPDVPHLRYSCLYGEECSQIRKYLLRRLGDIHKPRFREIANSLKSDKPAFEAQKRNKMCRVSMGLVFWFTVGVVGFGAAARRIRIRRQRAYFEAASRGKKQGVMPGSPLWMKAVIAALSFGLLWSVYMVVSWL